MAAKKRPLFTVDPKLYDKLKEVRASTTVSLKPTPMLRDQVVGFDGTLEAFNFRYYQVQGIFHLLMLTRMILGDGTGLGKCVTGGTLILTDRGLLPIEDLAPDGELQPDTFYDLPESIRVWTGQEWAQVLRFYWNGLAPSLRVTTRNRFQVEGSERHPLFIRRPEGERFCRLPEIEVGDYVCIDRSPAPFPLSEPAISAPLTVRQAKAYTYPEALTPDLARLLGYVVGEAWSNGEYQTSISQHRDVNPEPHDDIRGLLKRVFGWDGNAESKTKDTLVQVCSVGIRRYLKACGVEYTTAHHKVVPWCVLQGTSASVWEFLRGLFEGEASVAEGGVELSSSSENLIREVQTLLLRFGIISTVSPKSIRGRSHTYWRLTFFGDDARMFSERGGFVSSRKAMALSGSLKLKSNPNKDVVPHMASVLSDLRDALRESTAVTGPNATRKGSGLKQFGDTFRTKLKHTILGHRNVTYDFLRELLDVAKLQGLMEHPAYLEIQGIVENHYFYDLVTDVAESEAYLMDIEVDDPKHCFWGNGFINHNTLQIIGLFAYYWGRNHKSKAIVVAPKSALRQWAGEIDRFSTGIKTYVVAGGLAERKKTYQAFADHPLGEGEDKAVLIINYHLLVRDWSAGSEATVLPNGKPGPKTPGLLDKLTAELGEVLTIYDEATAFKNASTKTHQVCSFLSQRSSRCYGLTATLLKNNLTEGFSIYQCIVPGLFTTKTRFQNDFCVVKFQPVGGRRKIPIVIGYKNLEVFRQRIDPVFLGRPKHVVSDELPTLITREVTVELSKAEDAKYGQALSGVLELGDGEVKDYEEHKAFVALTYCQQVVNSLTLLKYEAGDEIDTDMFAQEQAPVAELGSKEAALMDLLTGEFDGEKVIVYTRFSSFVPRLQEICQKAKIKSVAITGKIKDTEKNPQRQKAMKAFQDPKSDVQVIFITDAGSESINLQAASAMIFFDAPWSWGNYVQLLGRPIRIGSPHQHVVAIHLVSERPRNAKSQRKTIDHYTLDLLQKKKKLVDKVLGESAVGALDFDSGQSFTRELIQKLQKGS